MLCRRTSRRSSSDSSNGSEAVYLNVYDLTSFNGYAYWLGLGAYHSALQVYGIEFAYGGHEHPTTGIAEGEPKQCEGFTFRRRILMGWTEMSVEQVREVMEELAQVYRGNAYNIIANNCNHFANDACIRLTGNAIPSWINRLARLGFLCKCIVPVSLNSTKVGDDRMEGNKVPEEGETNKKLRSPSKRLSASSSSSSSPSSPTAYPSCKIS